MNFDRAIDGLLKSGVGGGLAGGLAGGLLVNAIGGKKTRKLAGSALKLGGAALVGGLAWKAYERYRGAQGATVPQDQRVAGSWAELARSGFLPEEPVQVVRRDLVILRSMITAAHADGHIDQDEQTRIFERIDGLDLSGEEKGLLFDELRRPLPLEALLGQIDGPELAAEVYAASLLVLDPEAPASRRYLTQLADSLSIPAPLAAELRREVASSAVPRAAPGGAREVA